MNPKPDMDKLTIKKRALTSGVIGTNTDYRTQMHQFSDLSVNHFR